MELNQFLLPAEREIAKNLFQDLDVQTLNVSLLCATAKMATRFCYSADDPLWAELRECLYCEARAAETKKPLRLFGADKGHGCEWSRWTADASLRAHRAAMILACRVEKSDKIIQAVVDSKSWRRADCVLWDAYNAATDTGKWSDDD